MLYYGEKNVNVIYLVDIIYLVYFRIWHLFIFNCEVLWTISFIDLELCKLNIIIIIILSV